MTVFIEWDCKLSVICTKYLILLYTLNNQYLVHCMCKIVWTINILFPLTPFNIASRRMYTIVCTNKILPPLRYPSPPFVALHQREFRELGTKKGSTTPEILSRWRYYYVYCIIDDKLIDIILWCYLIYI